MSDSPTFDKERLSKMRHFLSDKLRGAQNTAAGVQLPVCEVEAMLGLVDSVLQQNHANATPSSAAEDPFAKMAPLSSAPSLSEPANDTPQSTSARPPGQRGRSQSVSFANFEGRNSIRKIASGGGVGGGNGAGDSPLMAGVSRDEINNIESRFSGMPMASRRREEGISPMDDAGAGAPFSLGGADEMSVGSGSVNKGLEGSISGGSNNGVATTYLSLDPTQSRRKSAVCACAPSLNLASPRRDGAEHLLDEQEATDLFRKCVAAVLSEAPKADFAADLEQLISGPADLQPAMVDVSDHEFEVLAFARTKCNSSERCCFIAVSLNVLCKYRFMETFRADPTGVARFVVRVLDFLPGGAVDSSSSSSNNSNNIFFTCPLRSATAMHTMHLILSDSKLGSQLTDIEIGASLFACLSSRAGNVCVSNEFLLRSGHPYARWFPGWSAQEHVAGLFVSETLAEAAPFNRAWWNSTPETSSSAAGNSADSGTAEAESCTHGCLFSDLVADLVLSTDTRHQQWLFRECSELLQRSEASAKGRARRGSIMFGDGAAIIRVADMHRILRCLVHLCEYSYTLQPYESFKHWVARWRAETARQGAAEQALHLPVSYHCRETTDSEEYHVHFMQIVVAPFTSMLAAVLPHAFTLALLDNTQRLAEAQAAKLDQQAAAEALAATAAAAAGQAPNLHQRRGSEAYNLLLSREAPAAVTTLLQQVHGAGASAASAAAAATSFSASPALFAVMRMVENRVRETVGGMQQQQALLLQRAPVGGVEAEAVKMLRRAKPQMFQRAEFRELDDEELGARFVTLASQNQTGGVASACNFATEDFFALLLRIVRYLNAC